MNKLNLVVYDEILAVCKLKPCEDVPQWAFKKGKFLSISRTEDELSIVCEEANIPKDLEAERGWKYLKVEGQLDFGLTGILYSIAKPMAEYSISIFAVSTYDTDYVLIKEKYFEKALELLSKDFNIKRNEN